MCVNSKRKYFAIILIFCFSLSIRILWNFLVNDKYALETGDQRAYVTIALKFSEGDGFMPDSMYRPPFYPFVLGCLFKISQDFLFIRLFQSVVSSFLCILIYFAIKHIADERYALTASSLVAINPLLIHFTNQLLTETLYLFLLWLGILFALKYSWINMVLSGFFFGLAILTRPDTVMFGIFFLAFLLYINRSNTSRLLVGLPFMGIGFVIIIAPWLYRNYQITDRVVLTTNGGVNLWIGANPDATGDYYIPTQQSDALSDKMTEIEIDDAYKASAIKYIFSHTQEWLELMPKKIIAFWRPYPVMPIMIWQTGFLFLALTGLVVIALDRSESAKITIISFLFPFGSNTPPLCGVIVLRHESSYQKKS